MTSPPPDGAPAQPAPPPSPWHEPLHAPLRPSAALALACAVAAGVGLASVQPSVHSTAGLPFLLAALAVGLAPNAWVAAVAGAVTGALWAAGGLAWTRPALADFGVDHATLAWLLLAALQAAWVAAAQALAWWAAPRRSPALALLTVAVAWAGVGGVVAPLLPLPGTAAVVGLHTPAGATWRALLLPAAPWLGLWWLPQRVRGALPPLLVVGSLGLSAASLRLGPPAGPTTPAAHDALPADPVVLLQPDLGPFDGRRASLHPDRAEALTTAARALRDHARVLVTPEGAWPHLLDDPTLPEPLAHLPVLLGAAVAAEGGGRHEAVIGPSGAVFKQRRVPLAERALSVVGTPWGRDAVREGAPRGTPHARVLDVGGDRVGVLLCYEDLSDDALRELVAADPDWLLLAVHDGWTELGPGTAWHLNWAERARRLTGLPVVRAAFGGPSAVFAGEGGGTVWPRRTAGGLSRYAVGRADLIKRPPSWWLLWDRQLTALSLGLLLAAAVSRRRAGRLSPPSPPRARPTSPPRGPAAAGSAPAPGAPAPPTGRAGAPR